jgi:hypothetical protein
VFAGWTLLVWATRIDNIWADAVLTTGGKVWRTLLAGSFVVVGLAVAAVAVRTWRAGAGPIDRAVVGAALGWTVAVWAVRATGIALGDHDRAFVVVHLALALLSTVLAWAAWRAVTTTSPTSPHAPEPAAAHPEIA